MTLSETGESRVNGYLFVLERSLSSFLPRDVVKDAVREIESHVRERIAAADGAPNERAALEKILAELGPPLRVAQAYSTERIIDEAVATGRLVPVVRAVWLGAMTTVKGFAAALALFTGYAAGFAFLVLAVMKPIFPNNVGIMTAHGIPYAIGAQFPTPLGTEVVGGYWVIPLAAGCGLGVLVGTHRFARRLLARRQGRRLASSGQSVA
jgi:hypothetical protein